MSDTKHSQHYQQRVHKCTQAIKRSTPKKHPATCTLVCTSDQKPETYNKISTPRNTQHRVHLCAPAIKSPRLTMKVQPPRNTQHRVHLCAPAIKSPRLTMKVQPPRNTQQRVHLCARAIKSPRLITKSQPLRNTQQRVHLCTSDQMPETYNESSNLSAVSTKKMHSSGNEAHSVRYWYTSTRRLSMEGIFAADYATSA